MSDEALRELERAWRATPRDGALATRLVDALRRAGRDAPLEALDARLLPPRTLRTTYPLRVQAWLGGVQVETVASASGRVVELPEHSTWQASVGGEDARERDWLARDLRELGAEAVCVSDRRLQPWVASLAGSAVRALTLVSTSQSDDVPELDARLLAHVAQLRELHLVAVCLEPASLEDYGRASRLERLSHSGFELDDRQVPSLAAFPRLAWLSIADTDLTSASVDGLAACAALRALELDRSGLEPEDVARLRAARPDLAITHVER